MGPCVEWFLLSSTTPLAKAGGGLRPSAVPLLLPSPCLIAMAPPTLLLIFVLIAVPFGPPDNPERIHSLHIPPGWDMHGGRLSHIFADTLKMMFYLISMPNYLNALGKDSVLFQYIPLNKTFVAHVVE